MRTLSPCTSAVALLLTLAVTPTAQAQNTSNTFIGPASGSLLDPAFWSLGTLPTVTNDAIFGTASTFALDADNLTVGSLNATASVTLGNSTNTATNSVLTLGGPGNQGNGVTAASNADLIYTASSVNFTIQGSNGATGSGVLALMLGQSGNFNVADKGILTISSMISDGGNGFGFTKTGLGSVVLTAANTYTGPTTLNGGTVQLLFSAAGAPTSNILSSSSSLAFRGGTLQVVGQTTGTTSQSFVSTSVNVGNNSVSVNANGGTSTTVNLGSITRTYGTILNLVPTGGWSAQSPSSTTIVKTTGVTYNDITYAVPTTGWRYVGAGVFGPSGTLPRYAQINANGQFSIGPAATTWVNSGSSAGTVYNIGTTDQVLTASQSMYAILANNPSAQNLSVTLGNETDAYTLTLNGLLHINSGTATFQPGVAGGALQIGSERDLVINTASNGSYIINVPILESTAGQSHVTIAGTGTGSTTLAGTGSTYTGNTWLNRGTLILAAENALPAGSGLVVTAGTVSLTTFNQTVDRVTLRTGTISGPTAVLTSTTGFDAESGTLSSGLQGRGITKTTRGTVVLSGATPNAFTGTSVVSEGTLSLNKTGVNAISGHLIIAGGLVTLPVGVQDQIADTAAVTVTGGIFNGTAVNTGSVITETIGNLTVSGAGIVNAPGSGNAAATNLTAADVHFTGGQGAVYVAGSGAVSTFHSLTLTNMTATPGGTVGVPNSFTIYGNSTTRQSSLIIGSGGLTLDGSVLNLRRGASGVAKGSVLVLHGDVTTTGTSASFINEDTNGGSNGTRDLELGGTADPVNRNFNIGSGADLTVSVPIKNGASSDAGIIKSGAGTLTLSTAASTYTGSTAIQGGTLHVNVNNSTLTGNVTVGGATATGKPTLGGTGTFGGAVTVRSASGGASGVLNPGVAIGTLSVANTVNFETDSIFEVDLGAKSGTTDLLSLTSGNFLLSFAQGSVLRLLPGDGFNLTTGDIGFTYLLASVQSGTGASNIAVNGATNLTTISTYTYGSGSVGPVMIDVSALPAFPEGSTLTLSRSGDNLLLTAAVVPEPATTGLLAAGALGLAGLVRQRRNRPTRQATC